MRWKKKKKLDKYVNTQSNRQKTCKQKILKNIFYRVEKNPRPCCSQYCSTAVNFNKANMLTLGIQNIRETVCIMYCTSLPRFQKGKIKSIVAHMSLPNLVLSSMYTQVNPT